MIGNLPPSPDLSASSPSLTVTALVTIGIRYALVALGVLGVYHGTLNDSLVQTLGGAIGGLLMVSWAIYNKAADYRHAHQVALINAARPAVSNPVQPRRGGILTQ